MQTSPLPLAATPKSQQTDLFARTSVVPMWKDTLVTINADGQEEAYSIAPDGFVWSYTVDSEFGRTGRLVTTGLRASAFAHGKSSDGHIIVIAADGALVHFVVETGNPKRRWSTPQVVSFSATRQTVVAVEKLFTQVLAGNLFVGVLARHSDAKGEHVHQFWEAIWAGGEMVFSHSPLQIQHQKNIWVEKLSGTQI